MRAVLDPNVLVSALIARSGSPAAVVQRWREGAFDLVVSRLVIEELERDFRYPKIAKRLPADDAAGFISLLHGSANAYEDPTTPPSVRSADRGDDYLIALAETSRSVLVSGDSDLLDLHDRIPVFTPAQFLGMLDQSLP